jgi:hypothetical protein
MKKFLVLAAFCMILATAVSAQSEDDFDIEQLMDNTLKITGYTGSTGDVVIPATISGLKVTVIGQGAFSEKIKTGALTSVIIPDTVTTIEGGGLLAAGAFSGSMYIPVANSYTAGDSYNASKLASVTLGKGLISIGSAAFAHNPNLHAIVIPNSVTEIGSLAFFECGLSSLTLGSKVQIIGKFSFSQNKLTELTVPVHVIEIGENAFSNNKISSLSIADGVVAVKSGAFSHNPTETLVLPPSLAVRRRVSTPRGNVESGIFGAFEDRSFGTVVPVRGRLDQLVSITLPANMSEQHLAGFETSFINFWKSQNKAGGTYVKTGRIWARQ